MFAPLKAQLAAVAELHAQCGGRGTGNVHPQLPLCSAGVASAGHPWQKVCHGIFCEKLHLHLMMVQGLALIMR